jgi:hypothetical protein
LQIETRYHAEGLLVAKLFRLDLSDKLKL